MARNNPAPIKNGRTTPIPSIPPTPPTTGGKLEITVLPYHGEKLDGTPRITAAGTPPIYDPKRTPELAFRFYLLKPGCTLEDLAKLIGVDIVTIYEWKRLYPAFAQAVYEGGEYADTEVARSLYKRAVGYTQKAVKIYCNPTTGDKEVIEYSEHITPDVGAAKLWLNIRQRNKGNVWTESTKKEITGADGTPLMPDAETGERARAQRARLLAMVEEDEINNAGEES